MSRCTGHSRELLSSGRYFSSRYGDFSVSNAERIFSAVFGALLLGIGIFSLFQDHLSFAWRLGGGFLLALLGFNSLWAAYRGKASWLSRLGPLP